MAKIGICGTGKMGSEITRRLLECNQDITIWNRTKNKTIELIKHGAKSAQNISELIDNSDVIIIVMGNDEALDFIYKHSEGIKNHNLKNKVIIELSTTSVDKIRSLEKIINALNGEFLECPVGGSTKPARDGNLLGLIGGKEQTFKKVEKILKLICRRYEYLGEVGKGTSMKLAINLPLLVYWQALGEALSIATKSGIEFEKAIDILMDSSGAAKVAHLKAPTMLKAATNPSNLPSTFNVISSLKDMKLMVEEGKKHKNQLKVIKNALSYVESAVNDGWSDYDASLLSVYINKHFSN